MRNDKNIYNKYCNDFQNPAIGAYIIAKFVEAFYENSQDKKYPNIVHIFALMPLIMNANFRKCIGNKYVLGSLVGTINEIDNGKLFGSYQVAIEKYKEYSMCSLVFASRLGFIHINDDTTIELRKSELPDHLNNMVKNAEKLGKLFSNGNLYNFLSLLGVNL